MITQNLKNIFKSTLNNCYRFSSHQEAPPTKLPKVKDIAINIYVKNQFGDVEKVPAFIGESLLEAIYRAKVHSYEFNLLCNGYDLTYRPHYRPHDNDSRGPICGSCRVVFQDNWFQRVQEQTDGYNYKEEELLSIATDTKSNTRLACCIPIQGWMEGMTLAVDVDTEEGDQKLLI